MTERESVRTVTIWLVELIYLPTTVTTKKVTTRAATKAKAPAGTDPINYRVDSTAAAHTPQTQHKYS